MRRSDRRPRCWSVARTLLAVCRVIKKIKLASKMPGVRKPRLVEIVGPSAGPLFALGREGVVVCEHGCIHTASEKLVLRFAAHRHLLPILDDGFDFLYG